MFIAADDSRLIYEGRIDFTDKKAPVLIYSFSSVSFRFHGTRLSVELSNICGDWRNFLGFLIDGRQDCRELKRNGKRYSYLLCENLSENVHDVVIFKRQDVCHYMTIYGFETDGRLLDPAKPLSERRMEFFGDSITCGKVVEATDYIGQEDPENQGEYTNAYYSYGAECSRLLHARAHITGISGVALLDGAGYFCEEDDASTGAVGMESCWDKLQCNPQLGKTKQWDFTRFIPHVVVIAIGQNDAHPYDYMASADDPDRRAHWKKCYKAFAKQLRAVYPHAVMIFTTTILEHDLSWDQAISEVVKELAAEGDGKVCRFFYSKNACGTPGHVRIPEAKEMADELASFIRCKGEDIWQIK